MNINNNLIGLIREVNRMNTILEEDDEKMEKFNKLSKSQKMDEIDHFRSTLKKVQDNADAVERLVFQIVKTEPDTVLRALHVSLVTYLDCEDYEKCHEISEQIKNYMG